MQYETRKPKDLHPHADQESVYGPLRESEYQALRDDIQKHGITQPIEITTDNVVLDGHHRLKAAIELNIVSVPVTVRSDLSKQEEALRFVDANLVRRQLDPAAKARALKHRIKLLCRAEGRAYKETAAKKAIADEMNTSVRTIDRYFQLLKTPIVIQNLVSEGRLQLTQAVKFWGMTVEQRKAVLRRIKNGESPQKVFKDALSGKVKRKQSKEEDVCMAYVDVIETLRKHVPDFNKLAYMLEGLAGGPEEVIPVLDSAIRLFEMLRSREQRRNLELTYSDVFSHGD